MVFSESLTLLRSKLSSSSSSSSLWVKCHKALSCLTDLIQWCANDIPFDWLLTFNFLSTNWPGQIFKRSVFAAETGLVLTRPNTSNSDSCSDGDWLLDLRFSFHVISMKAKVWPQIWIKWQFTKETDISLWITCVRHPGQSTVSSLYC